MKNHEIERLNSVKRFKEHDFNLNASLKGILTLTAEICGTEMAFITLVDEHSQWFKACKGLEILEIPRSHSFCTHAITNLGVTVVANPLSDERFATLPSVTNGMVGFYAGAPLTTDEGYTIGTLCAVGNSNQQLPDSKKGLLAILASQAMHLMELELSLKQIELQNKALLDIAYTQSHEFRGPLSTIMGCMNLIKDDNYNAEKEHLVMMNEAVNKLDEKIHMVVKSTQVARTIYTA